MYWTRFANKKTIACKNKNQYTTLLKNKYLIKKIKELCEKNREYYWDI